MLTEIAPDRGDQHAHRAIAKLVHFKLAGLAELFDLGFADAEKFRRFLNRDRLQIFPTFAASPIYLLPLTPWRPAPPYRSP
jgi:hypothetical protein